MTPTLNHTVKIALDRMQDAKLGKGELFPGFLDIQGHILLAGGYAFDRLVNLDQLAADVLVAELAGISLTHAILIRHIGDSDYPTPLDILTHPQIPLGPHAHDILAFLRLFDSMEADAWAQVLDHAKDRHEPYRARRAWADADGSPAHLILNAWETRAAYEVAEDRSRRSMWNGRNFAYAALAELAGAKWLPAHDRDERVFVPMFQFEADQ